MRSMTFDCQEWQRNRPIESLRLVGKDGEEECWEHVGFGICAVFVLMHRIGSYCSYCQDNVANPESLDNCRH